jgi:hypothetical protein
MKNAKPAIKPALGNTPDFCAVNVATRDELATLALALGKVETCRIDVLHELKSAIGPKPTLGRGSLWVRYWPISAQAELAKDVC